MKTFLAAMAFLFGVWWFATAYTGQVIIFYFIAGFLYSALKPEPDPTAPRDTSQPRDSAGRSAQSLPDNLRPADPEFVAEWKSKGGSSSDHIDNGLPFLESYMSSKPKKEDK